MGAFFGRSHELRRIGEELAPGAPVTLLGTAGTGKTRLAAEFAHAVDGEVAWAGLDDIERLLASPPDLVVLDDPVLRGPDRAAVDALAAVTRVLLTGRDIAGLRGEQVIALGPLPCPETRALLRQVLPAAPDELLVDVARITDGLPGAIEVVTRAAASMDLADVVEALRSALDRVRATGARVPRSTTMEIVRRWWEHTCPA